MHLGILTSHPIQYQAPWFRALAQECDLEVFFAHRQSASEQGKAGFGVAFDWDVDLLSGYQHRFLKNVSANPGVNNFAGCDNPEIEEIITGHDTSPNPLPGRGGEGTVNRPFDAFIVNGWYLKSYMQAVRACRRAGVPVLVRGDSQLGTPRPLLKRVAMEVRQRWLLRQFDGFLTVGQRNREYLAHYGVPDRKMFPVPHFVDNEWFAAKAAEAKGSRAEIRNRWGVGEKHLVVLFVGKFIPKKRPQDILRALSRLTPLTANARMLVVFVGAGVLETELRELSLSLKIPARFEGFKNQSELPSYYAAANVLVLPSDGGETWGLVVNEAMACGTPAIVSDAVGCAPDLIEEAKTGFVFRMGDENELAQRISQFAEMFRAGHRFAAALAEKLKAYSVEQAVLGTLRATSVVCDS